MDTVPRLTHLRALRRWNSRLHSTTGSFASCTMPSKPWSGRRRPAPRGRETRHGYRDPSAGNAEHGYGRKAGRVALRFLRCDVCADASGLAGEFQNEIRTGDRQCAKRARRLETSGGRFRVRINSAMSPESHAVTCKCRERQFLGCPSFEAHSRSAMDSMNQPATVSSSSSCCFW